MALTDTKLRTLKGREKVYRIADGGGLCIEVKPGGSRLWRWRYRYGDTPKMLGLGSYPECSLQQARQKAEELRALLRQGIDPSQQRKDERAEDKRRLGNTFAALAEAWYTQKRPGWAPTTADKVRYYLDRDLIPALGPRPMAEIRRADLVATLRKLESREALNVARKARGWLSGIFRYALVCEVIETNPATDLDVVAAAEGERQHHAHLPLSELPDFLHALDAYTGHPTTSHAVRLLLLTAVRPGELRHARWAEFDFERCLWHIPAERMKMRRPHTVPLPQQAIEILQALQPLTGHRDLVLPSRNSPRRPISENTLNQAIGRIGYKGRQTSHGFRHLISTALNERGYRGDWIEKQLAHGDEDEIRAVYNKAEYIEQRRTMMQEWADFLDTLRDGRGKVVAGNFGRVA